ncbi:phage tail tape measure protein, partial [Escherichia coli]|nr:phage tail tape measure protein [Escherichia coli]
WLNMFPNIARQVGYISLGFMAFSAAGAITNIVMGVFSFIMTGHKGIMKAATLSWELGAATLRRLRTTLVATNLAARLAGASMLT